MTYPSRMQIFLFISGVSRARINLLRLHETHSRAFCEIHCWNVCACVFFNRFLLMFHMPSTCHKATKEERRTRKCIYIYVDFLFGTRDRVKHFRLKFSEYNLHGINMIAIKICMQQVRVGCQRSHVCFGYMHTWRHMKMKCSRGEKRVLHSDRSSAMLFAQRLLSFFQSHHKYTLENRRRSSCRTSLNGSHDIMCSRCISFITANMQSIYV